MSYHWEYILLAGKFVAPIHVAGRVLSWHMDTKKNVSSKDIYFRIDFFENNIFK